MFALQVRAIVGAIATQNTFLPKFNTSIAEQVAGSDWGRG